MPAYNESAKQDAPNKFLTCAEAARLLGVCPTTLRRWTGDGVAPPLAIVAGERVRRYTRESIEAFAAVHQRQRGGNRPPNEAVRAALDNLESLMPSRWADVVHGDDATSDNATDEILGEINRILDLVGWHGVRLNRPNWVG